MRHKIVGPLLLTLLALAGGSLAQQIPVPVKVKGGHQLGETAAQFFAEGNENQLLGACAAGDFKSMKKPSRREAKEYCSELSGVRQQAMKGNRVEYKSGDVSDMRTDTFTFDGGRLVKVELVFSVPSAEFNYRGHSFEEIFSGTKQAYGAPTNETSEQARNSYGAPYLAHRELWVAPHAAILITEQVGAASSTTLVAFTRAEYDRTMAGGAPKAANPLE